MNPQTKPSLYVIGGPNGGGKTTLSARLILETGLPYIGADAIAKRLSPENVAAVAVAAGREFLRQVEEKISSRQGFIVESTLSGRSLTQIIRRARNQGFRIEINMVFLSSADQSLQRVRSRVRIGGHDVPEADVRRRFKRTLVRFWNDYRPLADDWQLDSNSGTGRIVVAKSHQDTYTVLDDKLFRQYLLMGDLKDDRSTN